MENHKKHMKVSWDDDIPFPIYHGKVIKNSMVPVTTNGHSI